MLNWASFHTNLHRLDTQASRKWLLGVLILLLLFLLLHTFWGRSLLRSEANLAKQLQDYRSQLSHDSEQSVASPIMTPEQLEEALQFFQKREQSLLPFAPFLEKIDQKIRQSALTLQKKSVLHATSLSDTVSAQQLLLVLSGKFTSFQRFFS